MYFSKKVKMDFIANVERKEVSTIGRL